MTVDDVAKRLIDYGFHAPTMSFPVTGTLMIEPTESESLHELDRFCAAMIAIKDEIDAVSSGEWALEDSPLRNAPHTAEDLIGEWERPYDRQLGAYPVAALRAGEVLPAGVAHRRRLRRPQPGVQLRAVGSARRHIRLSPAALRCGHDPKHSPGLGDLLGLFGGANPFGAITKSIGQFQRGVSDFLSAVENFNKTMEQLHGMANRVNGLLDTVEEPIKAFVPQVTRTIKAADAMVEQLSGPIERVAPGLSRLADVLVAPGLDVVADRPRRVHGRAVRPGPPPAAARPDGRVGRQHVRPAAAVGAAPQSPAACRTDWRRR